MKIEYLGQSGLKIGHKNLNILIDPYLSNSVQELDSKDLVRQVPIAYKPEALKNINWILITHEHIDHCDPYTIPKLAALNPEVNFLGPLKVRKKLESWGINKSKIVPLKNTAIDLGHNIKVNFVPCAHPELKIEEDGFPECIGWIFEKDNIKIYSAGDTCVFDAIFSFFKETPTIDIGILPVNEDNFFRRRRGIIGNMSIREAFEMADELNIKNVFPVHWDMFKVNSAIPEEIKIIYNSYDWKFNLLMDLSEFKLN